MTVSLDPSLIISMQDARIGASLLGSGGGSSGVATSASGSKAPTPPWLQVSTSATKKKSSASTSVSATSTQVEALMAHLASGQSLVNTASVKLTTTSSNTSANANYRSLFALYTALNNLKTLASAAQNTATTAGQLSALQSAFNTGLSQVQAYIATNSFSGLTLTSGVARTSETATAATPRQSFTYLGASAISGSADTVIPGLSTSDSFTISVNQNAGSANAVTVNVPIDLSALGSTPLTANNVVAYINQQLSAAGVQTKMGLSVTQPTTNVTNGVSITTPGSVAFQVNGVSGETVSFFAPSGQPAVYLTQAVGTASSATSTSAATLPTQQLLKINADPSQSTSSGSTLFTKSYSAAVASAGAVATGADGSVYVISDVTNSASASTSSSSASSATATTQDAANGGTGVVGAQDAVLSKYDSAGNLVFSRDLGAANSASAYSLSVSSDGGEVAVASAVSGAISGQALAPGATASTVSTTVQVYDTSQGDLAWSQNIAAMGGNVTPTSVAFAADGSVYVTGQTTAQLPDSEVSQQSASDTFLVGLSQDPTTGVVSTNFETQFGSSAANHSVGVTVSGNTVITASVENGDTILRSYSEAGAALSSRSLGNVQGSIAGLATDANGNVVVAGTASNPSIAVQNTQTASDGGSDVFVATVGADLSSTANDSLTYAAVPGGGDAKASAVSIANGQVYVAGATTGPALAGETTPSHQGFITALDPASGAVTWSRTLSGRDGQDAPNGLAVASQGVTALDALGLPTGMVNATPTTDLTASSNVKAGDSFKMSVDGITSTITISQGETVAALAKKISQASAGLVSASTSWTGTGTTFSLTPSISNAKVTLSGGPPGSDALIGLGLKAGIITKATSSTATVSATSSVKVAPYALGLSSTYSLSTTSSVQIATTALASAASQLQLLYLNLTTPKHTASSSSNQSGGSVPAYLSAQLANFNGGLNQLGLASVSASTGMLSSANIGAALLGGSSASSGGSIASELLGGSSSSGASALDSVLASLYSTPKA